MAPLSGHDINTIIDHITAPCTAPFYLQRRARPPPALELTDLGCDVSWAQRTPKDAPAVAHELAAGLDDLARALGEQMAATPSRGWPGSSAPWPRTPRQRSGVAESRNSPG